MGSKRKYTLDNDTLNHYLTIAKVIDRDIEFIHYPRKSKTRGNHGYHQWQSTYILANNDTVPNLFLTLKSMKSLDFTYHSFMLSYRHQSTMNIIYQLEIYPDDFLSHTEKDGTTLFGTHLHHLGTTTEIRPNNYLTFDWYNWLDYYIKQTNITIKGTITHPFDGELDL